MQYVNFEYYNENFPLVTEDEFNILAVRAAKQIGVLTHRRSLTATGYKLDAVKDCVCNLINELYIQDKTGNGLDGARVSSASNSGYSETYVTVSESEKQEQIKAVATQWLSGTGLMGVL